mgnify:CR=1 FL=1
MTCDVKRDVDFYKNGTKRLVEHYSQIDLYKIKANYGQGGWTSFIIDINSDVPVVI